MSIFSQNRIYAFTEKVINESYIINEKDILYNKDKFDSDKINLCFITGHSGSGKSTLAHSKEKNNIEVYELDDVVWNKISYTMENFKEYGDLIYSFFKSVGKKYYYTIEDVKNGNAKSIDNYEELLIRDFVKYAKSYANSHKTKKYIIEGVWLVDFCKPEEFKNYAFYIKGTSLLISRWRAAKRDSADAPTKIDRIKSRITNFTSLKILKPHCDFEKDLKKFRDYFKKLEDKKNSINESKDASTLDNNFK